MAGKNTPTGRHQLDDSLDEIDKQEVHEQKTKLSPLAQAEQDLQQALLRYSADFSTTKGAFEEVSDDFRLLAGIHEQRKHAKKQEMDQLEQVIKGDDKYAHKGTVKAPFSASGIRETIHKWGLSYERATKICNREGYTDLIQALYRLESERKKELQEMDKKIENLKKNLKEAEKIRANLKDDFVKAEEVIEQKGHNPESTASEPSLSPKIDALEDDLLNALRDYTGKKILTGHAEKLQKEFKELAYTYELIWGDKWKQARALRKALESENGEAPMPTVMRAKSTDLLKTHLKEAQMLMRGIIKVTAINPLPVLIEPGEGITTPEVNKIAYSKILIAFEKLQSARRAETKRLNREIRGLEKALKDKKEPRRDNTEIWDEKEAA